MRIMEMEKIPEYINKNINSKFVYLYILILCILFSMPFVNNEKAKIIIPLIVFAFIIITFVVFKERSFHKFPNKKIGILFAIDVEDEKYYKLINNKFVKEFRARIIKQDRNFDVVMLNCYTAKIFSEKYSTQEQIEDFTGKYNVNFIVFGRCVAGGESENIECKLHLRCVISHKPMIQQHSHILSQEMGIVLAPLEAIEIYKTSQTPDFERSAVQMQFAYEYILGVAYVMSSRFEDAFPVFASLKIELGKFNEDIPVVCYIKNAIDDSVCVCALEIASIELHKYYDTKDTKHLKRMKKYLDIVEKFRDASYRLKLLSAIYYFLSDRNVSMASKQIEDCKNITTDDSWKFSNVFLKLYQKDTVSNFLNAYRVYSNSFKKFGKTLTFAAEIMDFVDMVLLEEPDKKQLYFLLFLMNYFIQDKVLTKEYYDKFMKHYSSLLDNENFRNVLFKLGMISETKALTNAVS